MGKSKSIRLCDMKKTLPFRGPEWLVGRRSEKNTGRKNIPWGHGKTQKYTPLRPEKKHCRFQASGKFVDRRTGNCESNPRALRITLFRKGQALDILKKSWDVTFRDDKH